VRPRDRAQQIDHEHYDDAGPGGYPNRGNAAVEEGVDHDDARRHQDEEEGTEKLGDGALG